MAMPLRQSIKVATYLFEQKLRKREKFPLIVELEPLFACNLACEGCGKIQHPAGVLKQRMPVAQAVGAVLESGAPMVSIAGGEPLMHPQIDEIVRQLVARKKYVFLCTNAMLMRKKLEKFTPSPTSPSRCTSTGSVSGTTSRSPRKGSSTKRSRR